MARLLWRGAVLVLATGAMAACGVVPANEARGPRYDYTDSPADNAAEAPGGPGIFGEDSVLSGLARPRGGAEAPVAVNRYLWAASQDVLSFLPIETVDPFSGVIVYGYGTPPGGSAAYRGTVFIRDAALDPRSLDLQLSGRGGPVSSDDRRAIEDAILTRARQLRRRDVGL